LLSLEIDFSILRIYSTQHVYKETRD